MTPAQQHVSEEFLKVRATLKMLALGLTRDPDRAEDLLQDAYLRMLDKAELYRPGTNFIAWSTIVTRNRFIGQRRMVKNQDHFPIWDVELPSRAPTQGERLRLIELLEHLRAVTPRRRAMLLLIGIEGMQYDAVAKHIGVSEGTVKSTVSKARAQLRALQTGGAKDVEVQKVDRRSGGEGAGGAVPAHERKRAAAAVGAGHGERGDGVRPRRRQARREAGAPAAEPQQAVSRGDHHAGGGAV